MSKVCGTNETRGLKVADADDPPPTNVSCGGRSATRRRATEAYPEHRNWSLALGARTTCGAAATAVAIAEKLLAS